MLPENVNASGPLMKDDAEPPVMLPVDVLVIVNRLIEEVDRVPEVRDNVPPMDAGEFS